MSKRNNELILSPYVFLPNGTGCFLDMAKDKKAIFTHLVMDKLARTIGMFEYENTPPTFDALIFEIYLQTQGFCIVTKVNDNLYALNGTLGGELDASFQPTIAIATSPFLDFSEHLEIGKACVVAKADALYRGLNGINSLYAGLLAEAYLTLRTQLVNLRAPVIVKSSDETAKQRANQYFNDIEDGKLSSMLSEDVSENILNANKTLDYSNKNQTHIKDTMEIIQYLIARWNIETGLNDNYNMKREAINSTEVDSNTMPLLTIVDAQLESRKKAIDEINKLYGTSIKVKLGKNWERAYEYVIQALENAEQDNEEQEKEKIEKDAKEDIEK